MMPLAAPRGAVSVRATGAVRITGGLIGHLSIVATQGQVSMAHRVVFPETFGSVNR